MNDAMRACGAFADKRNSGVNRHPVQPGICELFFSHVREAAPDLKENFLVQIVLVCRIPCVRPADPENLISILIHQREKLAFT